MSAMRIKVLVATVIVAGSAVVVAAVEHLSFTGFCFADKRYHSDRELMDFAIMRALNFSDSVTRDSRDEPKTYRSADEFRETNPDCCELYR
jgi:hypothetical protein